MILAINLIGTKKESGSKTYILNFLANLYKLDNLVDLKTIYVFAANNSLKEINIKKTSGNIIIINIPSIFQEGILKFFFEKFILPFYLISRRVDKILFSLNYIPLVLKLFKIEKTLVIHSNLPWFANHLMPGNLFKKKIIKLLMNLSISAADKVIFCSYSAKKQLQKILKIKNKKLYFVYLGSDHFQIKKQKKNLDKILIISSITKYHPIINILKTYDKMLSINKKLPKIFLVTHILDRNYFKIIFNYFNKTKLLKRKIKIFYNLNNSSVKKLYSTSYMSINASLIESFGITSLESMRLGCPVLLSKLNTFKEINKNAVLYFNHNSTIDIKKNIKYLLKKRKSFRKKLILRGFTVCKSYTWKKTVQKTLNIVLS